MRNEKRVVVRRERGRGEMDYPEIARRLGMSIPTVIRIERIALAKLAVMCGEEDAFERLPEWIKKGGTPRASRET